MALPRMGILCRRWRLTVQRQQPRIGLELNSALVDYMNRFAAGEVKPCVNVAPAA